MIDILHAVDACSDLIDYWDVGPRADDVVLRVRSRVRDATDRATAELEQAIVARIRSCGHDVRDVTSGARLNGGPDHAWHVFVELVIG